MAAPDDASHLGSSPEAPAENSIRKSKRRRPQVDRPPPRRPTADASAKPKAASSPTAAVPDAVRARFVQVRNQYYFPDGARAFTDRGNRLTTPSENSEVVRSLIAIAKAREWTEITIRGTERFRKEAWFAASRAGLNVRGYRPSEIEQAHVVRSLQRQNALAGDADEQTASRAAPDPKGERPRSQASREGLLSGRLIDHGPARYRDDARAPMSYFVKLETSRGDRTVWGVDLERAFKESLTQPQIGDDVGLRSVRQDAVKVKAPTRDADGNVVGQQELKTHRNRWILEKQGLFESRAEAARMVRDATVAPKEAVKEHPELVGTYLQVRAAELAAKRLRDPEDRQQFVAKVRSALADAVARGEPLPPVRLRDRQPARDRPAREREATPVRG